MKTTVRTSWIAGSLSLALATPAFAEAPPHADARAAAAAIKKQADQAMDTLHYDEALDLYQRAYHTFPDPAVLYNEARVHQARGEYPEALEFAQRFSQEAPPELRARVSALAGFLEELGKHVAIVELSCNVSGARVRVHEKLVGTTPVPKALVLNAGKPLVEVEADGYVPFHREVDLPGGVTTKVDVVLEPKTRSGTLAIRVSGEPATVEIDHLLVKTTPLELQLDAGPHALVLRRNGFADLDTSATIVAGQRRELSLDLIAKTSPITGRWWFWTGIGVAVAGGAIAAIAIAASTDRGHGTGDGFSPGTQTAPLTRW
jgi:hypothetical protein